MFGEPGVGGAIDLREHLDVITPVDDFGSLLIKRDDQFENPVLPGINGGKLRTFIRKALSLQDDAPLVVATTSKRSVPSYAAVAALVTGKECHIWISASKNPTPGVRFADDQQRVFVHPLKPGYLSQCRYRAREHAKEIGGHYVDINHGDDTILTVQDAYAQAQGVFDMGAQRIVVPCGSGNTLAGILKHRKELGDQTPVIGVVTGSIKWAMSTLEKYGVAGECELVSASPRADETFGEEYGIELDPLYEARCTHVLLPGDLFWIVGTAHPKGY